MIAKEAVRGLVRGLSGSRKGLRSGGKDGEEHYTPFIVVGTVPGDQGSRPLPAGTVFWESPDVWSEGPAGINMPVTGAQHAVWARVHNFGLMPANKVRVRFWWTVPSTIITELDATLIAEVPGAGPIGASGGSVLVQAGTPWVPKFENGGHECLLVEAWVEGLDPLPGPPGGAMDPMLDRHTAQRNVTVTEVDGGEAWSLSTAVANGLAAPVEVTAELMPMASAEVQGLIRSDRGLHGRDLVATEAPSSLEAELRATGRSYRGSSGQLPARLAAGAARMPFPEPRHALHRLTARFAPLEIRNLHLTGRAPRAARPGTAFGYRVVQRIGDVCVGGATALIVIGGR